MQEAAEPRSSAAHGLTREHVTRVPGQKSRQRDAPFEPREIQPRTGMDSERECDVAIGLAADVETIRIRELRGVGGWPRRCRC